MISKFIEGASATVAATKAKAQDAEVAIGAAMIRRPKFTFWALLILALAGAKIISGAMR